jgi:hypothetical protein
VVGLTDPQSYAAFAYIDEHRAEVEGEYRVVLEQAEAAAPIGKNAIKNGWPTSHA